MFSLRFDDVVTIVHSSVFYCWRARGYLVKLNENIYEFTQ